MIFGVLSLQISALVTPKIHTICIVIIVLCTSR